MTNQATIENKTNAIDNFRNSLAVNDVFGRTTEELSHISTTQREAVDALLGGLSATANLAFFATEHKDYEENGDANNDLQKLSYCMMFTSEILYSFLKNSEMAELVLRQRGESL